MIYETLREKGMTDKTVALGLHHTVKKLRDESVRVGHQRASVIFREAINNQHNWDGTLKAQSELKTVAEKMINWFWVPYVHYGV